MKCLFSYGYYNDIHEFIIVRLTEVFESNPYSSLCACRVPLVPQAPLVQLDCSVRREQEVLLVHRVALVSLETVVLLVLLDRMVMMELMV